MEQFNVYKDMKARTNGEIYIGVVGPVRTGKSTFIKRFMNLMVLPNMEDEHERSRANDELPQSSSGKTIMTTEPKFVPNEAVSIKVEDEIDLNVRLIDCVGYMVDGATGHMEGDSERLVKTPWFDHEIPFTKAAAIGTKKVITEHSTIGVVVTCDGSFGEIEAMQYEKPEEETIRQLKSLQKPFVVLLNTIHPYSEETRNLAREKEERYHAKVIPMNLEQLKKEDIYQILKSVLMEFPITSIGFYVPKWTETLPKEHPLKKELLETARKMMKDKSCMRDVYEKTDLETEYIKAWKLDHVAMDTGEISIQVSIDDKFYYDFLSDTIGFPIGNEYEFIQIMQELAKKKKEYEEVGEALSAVKQRGYGVVTPTKEDITLDEPRIVKHGSKYGVKIKASAPSIHMIRANISTEIAPIVGEEYQAKDLMEYIEKGSGEPGESMWDVNIFGKTLEQLVGDGMQAKALKMTEESQHKLQETMEKIINESNGGLVCIII
ncbi:stage IV sporulation protein A [Anaerostipes sp. MSJ-23]|uniref:stage IV sporulation protein A n=1 Tax=unclassified Anaerostipes TaxID=2635253 RepID=UPI001C1169AF|nr:stage IV sporulation protein A [Anaerostipes sp. MSJ-23]MBU5460294.1 stage IV sporulation protein A [Anaerostipes sp. MSJ-23]